MVCYEVIKEIDVEWTACIVNEGLDVIFQSFTAFFILQTVMMVAVVVMVMLVMMLVMLIVVVLMLIMVVMVVMRVGHHRPVCQHVGVFVGVFVGVSVLAVVSVKASHLVSLFLGFFASARKAPLQFTSFIRRFLFRVWLGPR